MEDSRTDSEAREVGMVARSLTTVFAVALVACSESITFPNEEPFIEGTVIKVFASPGSGVWVKEHQLDPCGTVFSTGKETRIGEHEPDGSFRKLGFEDLTVGWRVRVWVSTAFVNLDRCPSRTFATAIEVLPR